jgi:hypothetical protein
VEAAKGIHKAKVCHGPGWSGIKMAGSVSWIGSVHLPIRDKVEIPKEDEVPRGSLDQWLQAVCNKITLLPSGS